MEKFLENYTTSCGERFSIYAREQFEPRTGDNVGLFFRIVPEIDAQSYWWCIIRLSGTLIRVWNLEEELGKDLIALGLLKIKESLENGNKINFDFMFTSFNTKTEFNATVQSLDVELQKLHGTTIKNDALQRISFESHIRSITKEQNDFRKLLLSIIYKITNSDVAIRISLRELDKKLQTELPAINTDFTAAFNYLESKNFLIKLSDKCSITASGIDEVENEFPNLGKCSIKPFEDPPLKLTVDEIFAFKKVKEVVPKDVIKLVPLKLKEDVIQKYFEEIIDEDSHKKDWGGETNDLFTIRLYLNEEKRIFSAFLLKGLGTTGELTIGKCGKNGDQIIRLFDSPAELFVIQHVDRISENVVLPTTF